MVEFMQILPIMKVLAGFARMRENFLDYSLGRFTTCSIPVTKLNDVHSLSVSEDDTKLKWSVTMYGLATNQHW